GFALAPQGAVGYRPKEGARHAADAFISRGGGGGGDRRNSSVRAAGETGDETEVHSRREGASRDGGVPARGAGELAVPQRWHPPARLLVVDQGLHSSR